MYYSQQNEDRLLFEKYFNYQNGFFIELGAMDGITYSNTLFYEKALNWKGILIEPTSQYLSLLNNRPNCYNFNYAISKSEGFVNFVGNQALGGIKDSMDDKHYYGWKLNEQQTYQVESKPMSYVLNIVNKINKIDKIDFFSLDVEGGELEVLETFNWDIPTKLILIEMSGHNLNKDNSCRELLTQKNFVFDMTIGCNEVWINKNNLMI